MFEAQIIADGAERGHRLAGSQVLGKASVLDEAEHNAVEPSLIRVAHSERFASPMMT